MTFPKQVEIFISEARKCGETTTEAYDQKTFDHIPILIKSQ